MKLCLSFSFSFSPQLFLAARLYRHQSGNHQFLHQSDSTLFCEQEVQELFPGKGWGVLKKSLDKKTEEIFAGDHLEEWDKARLNCKVVC